MTELELAVGELAQASEAVVREYGENRLTANRVKALKDTREKVMQLLGDDVKAHFNLKG